VNLVKSNLPIIDVHGVTKSFIKLLDWAGRIAQKLGSDIRDEVIHAVDNVNLSIMPGEVVGLVGESGCGKSTLGRMIAGILEPTSGTIQYWGHDITGMQGNEKKNATLKVQMIFQDPFASLNPRHRVRQIVGEAPRVHGIVSRKDLDDYVDDILTRCGLDCEYKNRYPHQFSGGQRQRIGIARALALKPDFIVCDESVSALDVSIQAQILNLFMRLQHELKLTYLVISHDISVVEHVSDRVVVMYLGRIVEIAQNEALFTEPNHPYTRILLREKPRLENRHHSFQPVEGEIPSPLNPPSGCYFHPRCPFASKRCRKESPELREIAPDRISACHLNDR
jgi:peptide/nickel transport system ATP-binding protein